MAADNGEEKLIAMARHIAKTLGHTNTMTDDILQIFSNFDGRFSRANLTDKSVTLEHTLQSLNRRISHYITAGHSIWSSSTDSALFLESIDELLALIREWSHTSIKDKTVSAYLDRAEDLLHQTMCKLEDEFRTLLAHGTESLDLTQSSESDTDSDDSTIPVAHPVTDYNITIINALPSTTITALHSIAHRMIIAGYEKECAHEYSTCRKRFIDESLSRLGLHKLHIEEVQNMQWSELEYEISIWIKSINLALQILFPTERTLCDRILHKLSPTAADLSYMLVCRGTVMQLLDFADAVAIGSRSPERLFKVLDVYETLRDLMPEFELLFSDQYSVMLRDEAVTVLKRLGDSIRGIFMELESLIRTDPVKGGVPGGGLHPITRYVMNYLRAACKSRGTLEQVFDDDGGGAKDPSAYLSVQMAWIMELLENNLEAKSKVYSDAALSAVFLMNNGRYIVRKVKDTELGGLLGDDWIRKHNAKIRQFHVIYQRSSWNKVLSVLKTTDHHNSSNNDSRGGGGNSSSGGGVGFKSMKEKLKLFNIYFEEVLKSQSSWVLFDEQMREELKISVSGNLLPAYRNFIGRLVICGEGRHLDKYIKFSVEEIEGKINNQLFLGNSNTSHGSK